MGSPRDTSREGEKTAHEPPEATETDLARFARTRAELLRALRSSPSAIFATPLVDVEVRDAKEHSLLVPLHFTVRALPDEALEALELTPAEQDALKQHQRAPLYTTLLATETLFDVGTHESANPRDDEREQLREQARELRRRRKEREGTDADPLVRSRRAAERLRAIKL